MSQVQVRMYRPGGVGDCFLLSFANATGTSRMMIDCGVLMGTEDGKARMQKMVGKIVTVTGGRLDVLVLTHEHWDHVSGFVQAREQFDGLQIGEIWLAWTEKADDDLAKRLREHKAQARQAINAAVKELQRATTPMAEFAVQAIGNLSQFFGDFGAAGAYSTSAAMGWAREHPTAKIRFLAPGDEPLSIPGVGGVRIFVLGPPRDDALLKKSDPSKRAPEVYQLAEGIDQGFVARMTEADGGDSGRPFDPSFERSKHEAHSLEFFKRHYYTDEEWRRIELDWVFTAERLALQLDSDTNNTSLVLAIELIDSGKVLLFPGDAQVGNWLSWASPACTWTVKDRNGESKQVTYQDLLNRTVLYKVGHHGSHNATLAENGLELMKSNELAAMISVYEEQARSQGKQGWDMPFPPLLKRLQEKTAGRILRADNGVPDPWPHGSGECNTSEDYIEYLIDL